MDSDIIAKRMRKPSETNGYLRYEREIRQWTQDEVAQKLYDKCDRADGERGIINGKMVSTWELGKHKPSLFWQKKLCELFGKNAEELGLISSIWATKTLVIDGALAINERLDQDEIIINLAWEAWFASRPNQARREITKLLPGLEKKISMPISTIHILRAKELIIRGHGLLGTVYLDALQNDAALYHYMQAHRFAEEIHDGDLTATYLCLIGEVLRRQKNPSGGLSRMENARDKTTNASNATRGHILQLLAYAYGDTGQETAFEHTISEVTDLLAFSGEGRDTVQKEFIPFEVYEIRGKINRDLGKPLQAIPYLELAEQSLNQADSATLRWFALLEISRAQACCDAGDIATGIELACKGFIRAYQCGSQLQMNRVRKLLRMLENSPFRNHPKIADLKNLLYETYMSMDNDQ